ncbi:MAG: hypothetical protein GTN93_00615 [Anaerolineae bacterium]|nr:hypothetical protein [Anaerolineae bacterium]
MDYGKVLKRAWEILWQYRVLWVFGVIVALAAAGGGGPNFYTFDSGDFDEGYPFGPEGWTRSWELTEVVPQAAEVWAAVAGGILAIVLGLACLAVIIFVVKTIFLYVGETALIRMVDDFEETGEKRGVRQGFRLGWSRTALRLFVIDLLSKLPAMVILFLFFLLGVGVVALMTVARDAVVLQGISIVAAIGLAFLVILLAIVIALAVSLVRPLIFRRCAVEGVGVIDSLKEGFAFIRRHITDVVLTWLIMIGLQIGWGLALIPVVLFLLFVGVVFGGGLGLLVGGLASLVAKGAVPWILGTLVGLPIFILVLAAPLTFLNGLAEVYKSSVWTLAYRELRALEGVGTKSGSTPAE